MLLATTVLLLAITSAQTAADPKSDVYAGPIAKALEKAGPNRAEI